MWAGSWRTGEVLQEKCKGTAVWTVHLMGYCIPPRAFGRTILNDTHHICTHLWVNQRAGLHFSSPQSTHVGRSTETEHSIPGTYRKKRGSQNISSLKSRMWHQPPVTTLFPTLPLSKFLRQLGGTSPFRIAVSVTLLTPFGLWFYSAGSQESQSQASGDRRRSFSKLKFRPQTLPSASPLASEVWAWTPQVTSEQGTYSFSACFIYS